jgi:hypothetical protein
MTTSSPLGVVAVENGSIEEEEPAVGAQGDVGGVGAVMSVQNPLTRVLQFVLL